MSELEILDVKNLSTVNLVHLNQIKKDIKDDYNQLVSYVYDECDKSIYWLVNSVLSRHYSNSFSYINLIYLELIKKLICKNNYQQIIVPNIELKRVLENYCKEINYNTYVVHCKCLKDGLKRKLRLLKCVFSNILNTYRYLLLKDKFRATLVSKNIPINLVDIFLEEIMLENDKFSDRYYTGMLGYLTEEEKQSTYYVPTFVNKKKLRKAIYITEQVDEKFLYKFDFLKFKDYYKAIIYPFLIKKIDFNKFVFRGVKIGPILKSDFFRNLATNSTFEAILNYRFFQRLKGEKVKLRLVINWFENQVIDRGFNKGVNDFYPGTHSIGYQGFIISSDYFIHLLPTLHEVNSKVIPNEIAVIGKGLIEEFKMTPDLKVTVAPAFRFSNEQTQENIQAKSNIIIIPLPSVMSMSLEILRLVTNITSEQGIKNVKFLIKPHPDLNLYELKSKLSYWLENYKIISGSFSKAIQQSNLMIGNASSTIMEALSYGVPVIVVAVQQGLTYNPIPENILKDIWEFCYTSDELSVAIEKFLNVSHEQKCTWKKIGNWVRDQYFEPVTKEGVRNFLKLDD